MATILFTLAMRGGGRAADAALFKNLLAAVVLGIVALLAGSGWGGGEAGEGDRPWLLISGALGLGIGDFLYFHALAVIGVGRTLVLVQIAPLLTALLAWPILGQTLNLAQWAGALAIVSGGILVESRRLERGYADGLGVLAALGCALAWAMGNVTLHYGIDETGPLTGASWRLLGGVSGLALLALLRGEWGRMLAVSFAWQTWRRYLVPSFIGTVLGMALLAGAFKWAKQGVAAALYATTPLFSLPLAVWLLGERPGPRGWSGVLLVVAGVILIGIGR